MTHFAATPLRGDDDDHDHDEESSAGMVTPTVDSGNKEAFNPPVEYKVVDFASHDPADMQDQLNALGKDGWVLVGMQPFAVLRRALKQDSEKRKHRVGFGF